MKTNLRDKSKLCRNIYIVPTYSSKFRPLFKCQGLTTHQIHKAHHLTIPKIKEKLHHIQHDAAFKLLEFPKHLSPIGIPLSTMFSSLKRNYNNLLINQI